MTGKLKPISVLLVIDTYPPVLGGSEIEAQRVSVGLIRRGHRVQVVCAGGPPMPPVREWTDPEGVPVTILTRHSRGRWKDLAFALGVVQAIWSGRKQYDIVYFLMQGLHLAAGLPVARFLRKPMIMKIAGSSVIPLMRGSRAGRKELNWLQRWGVPVMLLNQGMIAEAIADGFSPGQLIWMPNPVDTDVFRPPANPQERNEWRRRHDIPEDANVVIYVGRLSREKGLQGLLKGFGAALSGGRESMLILVGDGAMRSELESLARELNPPMDRIRFIGKVPIQDVPAWLRASDVYALTSPNEGFPCALLEAMSAGLCSVVSAIPANLQLVDDEVHGLTVPFDDTHAIGRAFLRLFRDPEIRAGMGAAARLRVIDNYSTERVIERYEKVFADMMNPK